MPLQRRIPKRGFKPRNRTEYQVVNVGELAILQGEASPETLRSAGLIRSVDAPVKILGVGEVSSAIHCTVHAISGPARAKIEGAGGSVTILGRGAAESDQEEEE